MTTCVHNIMSGEKYVEKYGDCIIESSSGVKAKLNFVKSGWTSSSRNDIVGEIKDNSNNSKKLFGRWDEGVYAGDHRATVCRIRLIGKSKKK